MKRFNTPKPGPRHRKVTQGNITWLETLTPEGKISDRHVLRYRGHDIIDDHATWSGAYSLRQERRERLKAKGFVI